MTIVYTETLTLRMPPVDSTHREKGLRQHHLPHGRVSHDSDGRLRAVLAPVQTDPQQRQGGNARRPRTHARTLRV